MIASRRQPQTRQSRLENAGIDFPTAQIELSAATVKVSTQIELPPSTRARVWACLVHCSRSACTSVCVYWQRSMISCLPMLQCFAWVEANLWLDAGSTDALVLSTTGLPARPGGCSGRVRGPRKSHMLSRLHSLIASYRQPNILVFFLYPLMQPHQTLSF